MICCSQRRANGATYNGVGRTTQIATDWFAPAAESLMTTPISPTEPVPHDASFAETALALGGKSTDETRRMGAVDRADEQVESLFAPQYQTVNSPAHRAVWERGVPVAEFVSTPPKTPVDVQRVMDDSVAVARRHVEAGTLLDDEGRIAESVFGEL